MIKLKNVKEKIRGRLKLPISCAGVISATGTTDSVYVVFNCVREVVVDNITNRVNIKSAGGDVSSDKGRYATVTKLFQDAFTLSLILKFDSKCFILFSRNTLSPWMAAHVRGFDLLSCQARWSHSRFVSVKTKIYEKSYNLSLVISTHTFWPSWTAVLKKALNLSAFSSSWITSTICFIFAFAASPWCPM